MLVVILEYASKLLVFGMVDGFDDESKVPRVIEEGALFPGDPNSERIYLPVMDTK